MGKHYSALGGGSSHCHRETHGEAPAPCPLVTGADLVCHGCTVLEEVWCSENPLGKICFLKFCVRWEDLIHYNVPTLRIIMRVPWKTEVTAHLVISMGFFKAFQKNKVLRRDFKQSSEMAFHIFMKRKMHKVGKVSRLYNPRILVFDVNIHPIMQKCKITYLLS